MLKNINVSITGATPEQRELVSNVITNSLVAEGYSNVALVNTVGEPMVGSDVPSLKDVLQKHHPEFLATPIRVWSIPVVDEPADIPENDIAIAVKDDEGGITIGIPEGGHPLIEEMKHLDANPQHLA